MLVSLHWFVLLSLKLLTLFYFHTIEAAIKALRAKYDPLIEEKKEKIAKLTEDKRDLVDFQEN